MTSMQALWFGMTSMQALRLGMTAVVLEKVK
jgi:hypothetical protein